KYDVDSKEKGALVVSVKMKSSASSAGIQEGDIIQKVDGKEITSIADYKQAIKGVKADQTLLLFIKRGKSTLFVGLKIKENSEKK
ncbi:MAG: PDZ domain-containing protein, partial [Fibrobacteres bacterium]|nr:PDZ domain-containing protein [Fibrobacterota bacterium]